MRLLFCAPRYLEIFGAPDLKKEEAGQGGSRPWGRQTRSRPHGGRDASGIDTALYCKKWSIFILAIAANAPGQVGRPFFRHATDLVIDTGAPIEDAIARVEGWSRPVVGFLHLAHELEALTAQALSKRWIELPVFASPTIAGVTLHDTDIIYGVYRERMLEAQKKHLPALQARIQGK